MGRTEISSLSFTRNTYANYGYTFQMITVTYLKKKELATVKKKKRKCELSQVACQ